MIRGIGEYPAVREVYLTHLRQVTKKLFCDLTTENRPGILYESVWDREIRNL